MEIHVRDGAAAELIGADDFRAFTVVLARALDGAERALTAAGAARVQQHAWIPVERVRELAGAAATAEWEQGLRAMVEYARSHGFYDDELDAIRAHVEYDAA
jgi:hypothetical protein